MTRRNHDVVVAFDMCPDFVAQYFYCRGSLGAEARAMGNVSGKHAHGWLHWVQVMSTWKLFP